MRLSLSSSFTFGFAILGVQPGCSWSDGANTGGSGNSATSGSNSGGANESPSSSGGTATAVATTTKPSGGASVGGNANGGAPLTTSGGIFTSGATSSASGGHSGFGGSTASSTAASCDTGVSPLQAVWPLPSAIAWSYPLAIAVDGLGNVYVAGTFDGSVTFGNVVLTSNGPQDMFLAKYDATGTLVYANRFGGSSFDDSSPAIAADDDGNAYFGGDFGQTLDMGGASTPLVALTSDAFVAKIGPTGQTLWSKRFGWDGETWVSYGGSIVYSIAIAPGGDPVIAGTSGGTITLGSTDWTPAGTNSQPYVARLRSSDGSVVWGAASRGTFDTDHTVVAVDSQGRTFLAGRVFSGGGDWGTGGGTYRVGFNPSGNPMWSRFDSTSPPMGITVDAAGRVAVVEDVLMPMSSVIVGGKSFATTDSAIVLLASPIDGSLISAAQVSETFPWGVVADGRGNSYITGTYWSSLTWGSTTLPQSGRQPLFMAAIDGTSKPAGLVGLGTTASADPQGIAIDRSGRIFVVASASTAMTSSIGPIAAGPFIAIFSPDACAPGGGPQGTTTGDASDHGDLLPDGSAPVTQPDSGTPGPCPASEAQAVNGADCPVKRGCAYGNDCCICIPTPCSGYSTTWTCTTLATPDPGCPASAPADGAACTSSGLACTYCTTGGRQLATCTAAGWQSGFAQLLCN